MKMVIYHLLPPPQECWPQDEAGDGQEEGWRFGDHNCEGIVGGVLTCVDSVVVSIATWVFLSFAMK